MKSSTKTGLKIFGLIISICGVWLFCRYILLYIFLFVLFIYQVERQVKFGRKYMDSLTEKDIQVWVDRTKKYLAEYDPAAYTIGSKPVPPELKQLRILRIDEESNLVCYVWAGLEAHTELDVKQMADGNFQFTEWYGGVSRVIWPKTTNTDISQTNSTFQPIK